MTDVKREDTVWITLDSRWRRSIRALAMSSLNNSSKPMTSHARVGLGHGCQAPSSILEHVTRAGGSWEPSPI